MSTLLQHRVQKNEEINVKKYISAVDHCMYLKQSTDALVLYIVVGLYEDTAPNSVHARKALTGAILVYRQVVILHCGLSVVVLYLVLSVPYCGTPLFSTVLSPRRQRCLS